MGFSILCFPTKREFDNFSTAKKLQTATARSSVLVLLLLTASDMATSRTKRTSAHHRYMYVQVPGSGQCNSIDVCRKLEIIVL